MKTLNAKRSFFVTKASKFLSLLVSVILLLGTFSAALPSSAADTAGKKAVFDDISKHWAKNDILWAYENAIAAGTAEKTFSPNANLTRGMFVTFLYRTARYFGYDIGDTESENPFADVKKKDWFYAPAAWAYHCQIVSGTGTKDGKPVFSPNALISRQETAAMIYRFLTVYAGKTVGDAGAKSFRDEKKIASWAKSSVKSLVAVGLFVGNSEGDFDPAGLADRASAVAICHRLYNIIHPTEENAPKVGCTAFSPRNINSDNVAGMTFETGRLHFCATLGSDAKVLLSTPDAEDGTLRQINAADYYTVDGKEHDYDVIWLENNAVLFCQDGERVFVLGLDRTYEQEDKITDEIRMINKEYQNPNGAVTATSFSFENVDAKDVCVYDLVDESPFAKHGRLNVGDNTFLDKNGHAYAPQGFCQTYTGTTTAWHYPHNDPSLPHYATTYEDFKWMRDDWGVSLVRIVIIPGDEISNCWGNYYPLYVASKGEDRAKFDRNIRDVIENCQKLGLYVLLDWHGYEEVDHVDDGKNYYNADPRIYQNEAREFFDLYSRDYGSYGNLMYDLYNEITGGKQHWGDTGNAENPYSEPDRDCINFFRDRVVKEGEEISEEELAKRVCNYAWTGRQYSFPSQKMNRTIRYGMLPGYEFTCAEIIYPYVTDMSETIRKNDPEGIIVIPTPEANQHPEVAMICPYPEKDRFGNMAYSVHATNGTLGNIISSRVSMVFGHTNESLFCSETGFYPDAEMEANGIPKKPENYRMVFRDSFIPWANNFLKKQNIPGVYWEHCLIVNSETCPSDLRSGLTEEMMTDVGLGLRSWWRAQEGMDS